MQILLTGASSFTGYWFARALLAAGHGVTACFRSSHGEYQGVRKRRVDALAREVDAVFEVEIGDAVFLDLVGGARFDLYCHHAAEMSGYRSWEFDTLGAAARNTRSAREICVRLASRGCARVVMTGSVFEPFEGEGDAAKRAINPYGLSKHISFEIYRAEAERVGLLLDKFVIPNPFGRFEEARFTSYLAKEWNAGRVPSCKTPNYVRDNIPVDLLARCYRVFCERAREACGGVRAAPSGYVEPQGGFALRVAREYGARLGRSLAVELLEQTAFDEPLVRINQRSAAADHPDWSAERFWDCAAEYWNESST